MNSQHPPRDDSEQTTLTLHRNAAGLLEEDLPPLCLACGAQAAEVHPMHWDRNYKRGGIFEVIHSEPFEGHIDSRPWTIDVPLCPEHLAWYERRRRQLLLLLIPFILGTNFSLLALLLVYLSPVQEAKIVADGLLIVSAAIFFIGLCLGVNYSLAGRKSIRAVKITGDTLKLDGVSPKVVDSLNEQWEQRTLQGLQEPPPPLARPVRKEEPPFDWQDVTG